jgi:hypothetical protein
VDQELVEERRKWSGTRQNERKTGMRVFEASRLTAARNSVCVENVHLIIDNLTAGY